MWSSARWLIVFVVLAGCGSGSGDISLSPEQKQQICGGAIPGARDHCLRLGIPEDQCKEIASEAFRVCFESAPGG
jgi:hypothetical protein